MGVGAKENAFSKDDKTNSRPGKYICRPELKTLRFEVFFYPFLTESYIFYI